MAQKNKEHQCNPETSMFSVFLLNHFAKRILFSGMEFHREIGRGYLNCPFIDEEKLYYIIGEFEIIWPGNMTYNERLSDIHEHLWDYIDTDNCIYNEADARFDIYRKMHWIMTFYSRMEFPTTKAEIRDGYPQKYTPRQFNSMVDRIQTQC